MGLSATVPRGTADEPVIHTQIIGSQVYIGRQPLPISADAKRLRSQIHTHLLQRLR